MTHRLSRRALLRSATALAATALPALSTSALAQGPGGAWPNRPIKWVVPYLAGTGPDSSARIVAEALGEALGQAVVIENRPGAGGNIGARQVARASADGYTWLYSGSPMAAAMRVYKQPGYDVFKDFQHVLGMTRSDILVVVHPDSGIRSLADLAKRAKGGTISYGSGGVGTPSHLGVELLLSSMGIEANHIPYKGASELVNAVMGKQVAFGAPIFSVAYPFVQTGKMLALGVAAPQRNAHLPKVPTLAEQGAANVNLTSFGGLSVPSGTPPDVVARVRSSLEAVLRKPAVAAALEKNGGQVEVLDGSRYAKALQQEIDFTEAMMQRVKLEAI